MLRQLRAQGTAYRGNRHLTFGDGAARTADSPGAWRSLAHSEVLQEALNYFLLYYREHKLDNTRVYDGIAEALQQAAHGAGAPRKLAVLTNKPVRVSRDILVGLGLSDRFVQVYGGQQFRDQEARSLGREYPDARSGRCSR